MKKLNYGNATREHLEKYNRVNLGAVVPGVFVGKDGRSHDKWHVLPKENWRQNFLEACEPDVVGRMGNQIEVQVGHRKLPKISLHRYFHHLNSSQALCLNLFLPLIHEGKVNWFLEHSKIPLPSGDLDACFEKESPWEKRQKGGQSQRTSFDFYVEWSKKTGLEHVFVELKYSESGFGAATNDEKHRTKFCEVYQPMLEQARPFFCEDKQVDCPEFLRNYQVLRNLVHISENSHVVFLVPKGNLRVVKAVEKAMNIFLSIKGKERCHLVFLEDFLDDLLVKTKGTDLETHFCQFENRYFPPEIRSFGASPT